MKEIKRDLEEKEDLLGLEDSKEIINLEIINLEIINVGEEENFKRNNRFFKKR